MARRTKEQNRAIYERRVARAIAEGHRSYGTKRKMQERLKANRQRYEQLVTANQAALFRRAFPNLDLAEVQRDHPDLVAKYHELYQYQPDRTDMGAGEHTVVTGLLDEIYDLFELYYPGGDLAIFGDFWSGPVRQR